MLTDTQAGGGVKLGRMSQIRFLPPFIAAADLVTALRRDGFAVLSPQAVAQWLACDLGQLQSWLPFWSTLPPDEHLKDGGRYRRRRHASFVVEHGAVRDVPHRAHWQPLEYNALHGGMERWFEPMLPEMVELPLWRHLIASLGAVSQAVFAPDQPAEPWYVEAHQFRIDTSDGIGRPTPEGAHRDGVDLVAVFLVAREGVKGGETRVFEAHSPAGQRFTLDASWSLLLLDDARMVHETTPIQPLRPSGYRDTLVVTARRKGFQDAR